MEEIPPALMLYWDHTSLKYVPSSPWMMAKEGSKRRAYQVSMSHAPIITETTEDHIEKIMVPYLTREQSLSCQMIGVLFASLTTSKDN